MSAICKSFVRSYLDQDNLVYDQANHESFCQQIKSVQCNASLAITGAIKGTSRFKIYNKIGLESLKLDNDSEDFVPFEKLKVLGCLHTCLTLLQKAVTCTILAY